LILALFCFEANKRERIISQFLAFIFSSPLKNKKNAFDLVTLGRKHTSVTAFKTKKTKLSFRVSFAEEEAPMPL